MGFFSGGKSTSTSDSFSGLRGYDMSGYNALMGRTPGDVNFLTNRLQDRVGNSNPLGLNSQGFTPEQMQGVNVFGQNLFNNVSGNYASRGFTSPENINGVIGSAVTQATPQLMSMIGTNQMNNQQLVGNRFDQLQNAMNLYPQLLGGQTHQTSTTTAPGLGYTFGSSVANGLGNFFNPQTYTGATSQGSKSALMF